MIDLRFRKSHATSYSRLNRPQCAKYFSFLHSNFFYTMDSHRPWVAGNELLVENANANIPVSLSWLLLPFSAFLCFPVTRGGGCLLSIFVQRGCAVFQGIVFAYFSRTGYQKKANFLEQVVKTCQKRKFCYNGLLFRQIFVFLSILFTDFL